MEYERKGVIITWQIENAKYIYQLMMELYSPVISVDGMDGTKWKLGLHRMSYATIWLTIKREEEDNGPEELGLDYEFSVNAFYRKSSHRKGTHSFKFQKGKKCNKVKIFMKEIHDRENCMVLTPDIITVQCKIYRQRGSIPKSVHFYVRTRMRTEYSIFVGEVENFSSFSEDRKKTFNIVSPSTGEILMKVNVSLFPSYDDIVKTHVKVLKIEFIPVDIQGERFLIFKLFFLDFSGNKTYIDTWELNFTPVTFISPHVSQEDLMENAALYLPLDILSLHCELTFYSGKEYEKVERIEYETDSVAEVKKTEFSNALKFLLSKEGILCDMKLQTATETFPAHTAILSAKSPIFEAMFKSNMKETIEKCVHIADVEAETLKRMLLFLYSDTLEELEWKDAMKLYAAADKYQILPLKQKCTISLEESVDLSNCCVLLLLADMHYDKSLKRDVRNYIAENRTKVLHCDQWRDLEKNLPQLAIETLRDLFL
ncbi:Speckle-type POZ protein [Araneus ventricosus]|uniref:Speckle-type POZ protein n=1 Tax=Araneus ventricosus TaxID=182803 RepID=A0A4Y2DIH1_ARAVE|nr:Speckle-type POZ protein [Araneus ventricosus]